MGKVVSQDDITHGLYSLQFHTNLNESELSLLHLRKRSFELLLHGVSQSVYIVGMLNTITHHVVTGEVLQRGTLSKHRVNIGFIGGGRLCRHIISTLVHHAVCVPHDISVSTYQPDKLEDLTKTGVHVCFNNRLVLEQSDVVFLCIPANQLVVFRRDVDLLPHHFLIAYVSTLSKESVAEELQHCNILKTDYHFNKECGYIHSEPYQSVAMTLEDEEVVERLFPGMESGYVYTSPDWLRDMCLLFYRYILKIASEGALQRLNTILFGSKENHYLLSKDFRVAGGPNRIASEADHLNDIIGLGSKVTNLNAKIFHKETLMTLFDGFKSFFKPKSVDVSQYR